MGMMEHEEALAPGTGEVEDLSGTDPDESAGTENTEGQGPPETIPYSRFKEVNDRLRGYRDLEELGYDADSLHRLVAWETEFLEDPAQFWMTLASSIDNMPDAVKEAIVAAQNGTTPSPAAPNTPEPPTAGSSSDEMPEWARELAAKVDGLVEKDTKTEAQKAEARRQSLIDKVLNEWQAIDEREEIPSLGVAAKLAIINQVAQDTNIRTIEQLVEAARAHQLEYHTAVLQATRSKKPGGAPRPVPGTGAGSAPSTPPPKIRTLEDAKAAAEALVRQGILGQD